MKRLFLPIILSVGALVGCENQLDQVPPGNLTDVTYFKTANDAKAAVGACYGQLTNTVYGGDGLVFIDLVTTDDGIPFLTGIAERPLLWRYNIAPSNTFANQWGTLFNAVNKSNTVIARLPAIQMDENVKKRYIAEAKFLRALNYFHLVRLYGGVPLITQETTSLENLQVPRATVDEIYALIEADLKEAETVLPKSYPASESGRATQGAAKGLLAKVYLTRAGADRSSPYWAQAAAKAKEVIDLGVYDLWANYADAFAIANRGGKEFVFEVQFLTDVRGNNYGRGYGPRSAPLFPSGGGSGIARVTPSLFNAYSAADKRKAVTFMTSFTFNNVTTNLSVTDPDPTKAVSFQKLWDPSAKTAGGEGKSFTVMRFAEVLLIYAEALNEANNGPTAEGYAAINRVRTRAGLTPLSGLSYAEFREAVWLERRLELAFEHHRRFDLIRTGRLIDAVKAENSQSRNATIQPFHVLLPIPQTEIDANPKLTQNPGY